MQEPVADTPSSGWPIWLKLIVAPLIAFHLATLVGLVLSSQSGPWVFPFGEDKAHEPFFAAKLYEATYGYLDLLRLQDDYHFPTHRANKGTAQRLEVRLKDGSGKEIRTIRLPDPNASPWTRHRQQLLVDIIADYQAISPPEGESIPPPGAKVPMVQYWKSAGPRSMQLKSIEQHLLPRDEELHAPTPYARTAVQSLAQALVKQTGAKTAEIVWHSKPYVGAVALMKDRPKSNADEFQEYSANFGDLPW